MNPADRSIARVDELPRSLFSFVEILPKSERLKDILVNVIDIVKMLDTLNKRSDVLFDREHTIGYSYFLQPLKVALSIEHLATIFGNKTIPLLQDYFYDDYGKIQLVLDDNQRSDDSTRFIVTRKVIVKFFGNVDIDFSEYYETNGETFN